MATTKKDASDQIVRALQAPDIPADTGSASWSPPVLIPRQPPQPLDLRFPVREPAAGDRKEEQVDRPVPAREPESEPEPDLIDQAPISPDEPLEQIADRRPEDVARAIQTILGQPEPEGEGGDGATRLGDREIAILIVGLGTACSSKILKYCEDGEIEEIARAVSQLDTFTARRKDEVYEGMKQLLTSGGYTLRGGVSFAREMLQKALGPRKAQALMDRVTNTTSGGFSLLRNVEPQQIVPFISKEHPQTIALILSQLEATQAAGVLNGLSRELQSDVAYRIARMTHISPQVMRSLEESLAADLQTLLSGQITEIGGPKVVAEILNRLGQSTEKEVLEDLNEQDPELAEEVRDQMFVFDDIANLTDREIQMILKEWDMKDLATALKGASKQMQDRVFSNVSEEVREQIKEEMQVSGPVRMSDVEEVQLRIGKTVRQLEQAGQITVVRGDSKDLFV